MTTLDDSTRLVDQVAAQHVFPSVKHGASTSQSIAGMTKPLQFRESPLFSEKVGRLAQTAIANTKGMSRILLGQQEYTVRAEWPTSQNVSTATPETGSGTVDIAGATDSGPEGLERLQSLQSQLIREIRSQVAELQNESP